MPQIYKMLVDRWPIVSIEDGLAEDDWQGFIDMMATEKARIQIVGDDLLVNNPTIIREAIGRAACTATLIKPNQIGTVSETLEAVRICHHAGWATMVSHRSGETTDDFIADLAVGTDAGQIKSGAPCRGERLAKYNRLLEIERELGSRAQFTNPFAERIEDAAASGSARSCRGHRPAALPGKAGSASDRTRRATGSCHGQAHRIGREGRPDRLKAAGA